MFTVPTVTLCIIKQGYLRKFLLQQFRGALTAWTMHWDLINPKCYLKSLLEGVTYRAIPGLTLSDTNYDSAIGILQE